MKHLFAVCALALWIAPAAAQTPPKPGIFDRSADIASANRAFNCIDTSVQAALGCF